MYKLYNLINERLKVKKSFKYASISPLCKIINSECLSIGNRVTIGYATRIEAVTIWKNKKYKPEILIMDDVNIEQGCHITCANKIVIEQGVSLLPYCMVTDIKHQYQNTNIPSSKQNISIKETIIGARSSIGFGACIMPGVKIGKHCVIGANAVVTSDIPDYSVAVGVPAKVIKRYDFIDKRWKKV